MTQKLKYALLLCLLAWLGGCTTLRVAVDSSPNVDLTKYRTFRFTDSDSQTSKNPLYKSSLIDQSIHATIASELIRRGVSEVDTNADMLVAYHTYTEKKRSSVNDYYPMMYGGWYWRYYPWGGAYGPYGPFAPFPYAGTRRTYTYTEGTLIIDIVDAATNQTVWRGSTAGAINNPSQLSRQAEQAVRTIFKEFPLPANNNRRQERETISRR